MNRQDTLGRHLAKRPSVPRAETTRTYELEYPCKYFGVERQKDTTGAIIANTTYAVNNIFLDGVRIAAVVPTGHARYFHTDQVDSVHVVTNDTGAAINRTEYLPFGETWFTEGEKAYAPKFNSQELDKESGLYFFNARHQDPELGRFETADTVVDGEHDTQGWNRYAYVKNNPIIHSDPTGHLTKAQGVKRLFPNRAKEVQEALEAREVKAVMKEADDNAAKKNIVLTPEQKAKLLKSAKSSVHNEFQTMDTKNPKDYPDLSQRGVVSEMTTQNHPDIYLAPWRDVPADPNGARGFREKALEISPEKKPAKPKPVKPANVDPASDSSNQPATSPASRPGGRKDDCNRQVIETRSLDPRHTGTVYNEGSCR